MEWSLSQLKEYRLELTDLLKKAPYTGKLWLDILLIFVCALLQHAILPTLTAGFIPIDLMTPWLVIGFVCQPLLRSALLLGLGALLVELHSTAPAGLYLAAYWVIAITIWSVRSSLSWWHAFPWAVTLIISELFIICFEAFVHGIAAASFEWLSDECLNGVLRLSLSVLMGMGLCQPFMHAEIVEDD